VTSGTEADFANASTALALTRMYERGGRSDHAMIFDGAWEANCVRLV
jgi:hypothetical protein